MEGGRKGGRLKQVQGVTGGRKQEDSTMKRGDRQREDDEGKRDQWEAGRNERRWRGIVTKRKEENDAVRLKTMQMMTTVVMMTGMTMIIMVTVMMAMKMMIMIMITKTTIMRKQ